MVRTLILCLLLIAATTAVADDTAIPLPATASAMAATTPAAAATAPITASASVTTASHDATTEGAKKPTAGKKASDGKADPAAAASQSAHPSGDVNMSGMSILGNEDAPKSLVIVPWKSSQLADMPSVSRLLDSTTQPVDKDVFMRELAYYEFTAGSK